MSKQATTPSDLTLVEIMARFATDEAARAYLESVRWPDGPVCPNCGNADGARIYDIAANPAKGVREGLRECAECHKQFTVTVGTIFEDSHIPLRKWLIAWYLLCSSKKGIAALQIQRMLAIGSYRSAWFMMHRIRYALRDPVFADKLGSGGGTVEADETYVGGKPRKGGKKSGHGRGTKKTPVVSLVQRGGAARSFTVKDAKAATLRKILRQNVDPSATLMTDEWRPYLVVGREFHKHERVSHGKGEYARSDGAHVNSAEGYFSLFKRGLVGTFHQVGHHYLDQYLAEFDFRYSHRKVSDGERTVVGLKKVEGKRLMLHRPRQAVN
jgi:transposase-like protein